MMATSLSDGDRAQLEALVRTRSTPQHLAQRARIVLSLADGAGVGDVVKAEATTRDLVYRWRLRFRKHGLAGLMDEKRSGRPRGLSDAKVCEILTMTVDTLPHEATHWSIRLLAKYAKASSWHVRKVLAGADLKPHRLKTFKVSKDPLFAEKVVDVVGLYMNPPDKALVLSVDEKTQIQALDRTQPMLQLRPGQIERRTHDYKRNGTASLYAAFDIASGKVLGRVTSRHRAKEFLDFLRQIDKATANETAVHVILDNSSTHKTAEVKAWLAKHPRFTFHFTPTSASWMNAVEGWFSLLERRAIYRGVFTSVADLHQEILRFINAHNALAAKPFVWTKDASSILASVDRARERLAL